MNRKASAVWMGGLKDGRGTISTESRVLADSPYGFAGRFESGTGTNPEELIAAAHAGCFSMALSAELGKAGLQPQRINTTATVTMDKDGAGFSIVAVHLALTAVIPGASEAAFLTAASQAKEGCPVSKLLKARITLDAKLTA